MQFSVEGRDLAGAVDDARRQVQAQVPLPEGYRLDWGGEYKDYTASRRQLNVVLPLTLFVIFLLLFALYRNFKFPAHHRAGRIAVRAGGRHRGGLWLTHTPFSVSSGIGFLALFGVSVQTAVVYISYVNELRAGGMEFHQAIRDGAILRLRPIMMTALVAALGLLPAAMATGVGTDSQRPFALVIVSGLFTRLLISVFLMPALYVDRRAANRSIGGVTRICLSPPIGHCYKSPMAAPLTLGFIGAGKMATALAAGFIRAGLVSEQQILASDPMESARAAFATQTQGRITGSNAEVVSFARVIVLAVKPGQVPEVLSEIRAGFTADHLLLSIAAGVPLAALESALPGGTRVIRVMPNTPALVGASASAFALGTAARRPDAELAQNLLGTVGLAFELKESLLDAVTGLSGSGPAYIYLVIEALSDGGVAAGLPREVATKLAAQTVLGSAKMVLETGLHPGALKDMVASPGGTTIEGLCELEKGKLRGTLIGAVRAAAEKSKRLGKAGG